MAHYFSLKNVNFDDVFRLENTTILFIDFDEEQDRLDVVFNLFYKGYPVAEIDLELFSPFQFKFIGNAGRVNNLRDAAKLLDDEYESVSKFELTSTSIILNAKNEHLDFHFETEFETLNLEIEYCNSTDFIDLVEKKDKHNNLFHRICKTISDTELTAIAHMDYGWDAEMAFKELKHVRDTETIPKEISYIVSEVLELTQYSSPIIKSYLCAR